MTDEKGKNIFHKIERSKADYDFYASFEKVQVAEMHKEVSRFIKRIITLIKE